MMPKTLMTPYTRPTIPTRVSSPHIAISDAAQPVVEVFFTVKMNTFARTTTEMLSDIIPDIKLLIFNFTSRY